MVCIIVVVDQEKRVNGSPHIEHAERTKNSSSRDERSSWKDRWLGVLFSVLVLISTLYRDMGRKLRAAEHRITELTALLQKRNEMLQSLATIIDTLKERSKDNERNLEIQQHEIQEQDTVLYELNIAQQFEMDTCQMEATCQPAITCKNSRIFWLFRKHKQNLMILTKSRIQEIIKAAMDAGLVSEYIGECATKCQIPNHDCTSGFYKALQVKINKSPDAFKIFLQLIQQKLKDSESCHQLCSKILTEMNMQLDN